MLIMSLETAWIWTSGNLAEGWYNDEGYVYIHIYCSLWSGGAVLLLVVSLGLRHDSETWQEPCEAGDIFGGEEDVVSNLHDVQL